MEAPPPVWGVLDMQGGRRGLAWGNVAVPGLTLVPTWHARGLGTACVGVKGEMGVWGPSALTLGADAAREGGWGWPGWLLRVVGWFRGRRRPRWALTWHAKGAGHGLGGC